MGVTKMNYIIEKLDLINNQGLTRYSKFVIAL
jgi:hypothetical protein